MKVGEKECLEPAKEQNTKEKYDLLKIKIINYKDVNRHFWNKSVLT